MIKSQKAIFLVTPGLVDILVMQVVCPRVDSHWQITGVILIHQVEMPRCEEHRKSRERIVPHARFDEEELVKLTMEWLLRHHQTKGAENRYVVPNGNRKPVHYSTLLTLLKLN